MFGAVFSKLKTWLLVLAFALGPVLYAIGIRRGQKDGETEQATEAAKANETAADFYRRMEGLSAELDRSNDRDDLADRLRSKGL